MGSSPTDSSTKVKAQSQSPTVKTRQSPSAAGDSKNSTENAKSDSSATNQTETTQPLAPPPRPAAAAAASTNTPDYFSGAHSTHHSYEPNPFEQSFGNSGGAETPGGTKLPSVAALTSPALPGTGSTPFGWGSSLRTGPLSPAMLSGPTNDYFGDSHFRGGFTPNESSLRTGLTPGGGGSMFPAPSPNSQALLNQLASGGATPSTIDFHRTALNAAAANKRDSAVAPIPAATSQPEMVNGVSASKSNTTAAPAVVDPFGQHDANDAANGLFMLAQARQPAQGTAGYVPQQAIQPPPPAIVNPVSGNQSTETSPNMPNREVNGTGAGSVTSGRGVSEISAGYSDDTEKSRPATRGKAKKAAATNGRRKADETPSKAPASKKAKANSGASIELEQYSDDEEDEYMKEEMKDYKEKEGKDGKKMTDEEKRKNFLERNRVAALKCRQRKKQWLANLQQKVELFSAENDSLNGQISALRDEVVNLKTLLLAHKDCPVTQSQGMHNMTMNQIMADYQHQQINPYGMAGMNGQQVMAGTGINRRFS